MKYALLITVLIVFASAGCKERTTDPVGSTPDAYDTTLTERDNTEVNTRDRYEESKTSIDQNENQSDIDITANIRKRVVDTEMSINAQNVKIITQNGRVTLRGPVKSEDEKAQIERLAQEVAGAGNVDNQLEVEP